VETPSVPSRLHGIRLVLVNLVERGREDEDREQRAWKESARVFMPRYDRSIVHL